MAASLGTAASDPFGALQPSAPALQQQAPSPQPPTPPHAPQQAAYPQPPQAQPARSAPAGFLSSYETQALPNAFGTSFGTSAPPAPAHAMMGHPHHCCLAGVSAVLEAVPPEPYASLHVRVRVRARVRVRDVSEGGEEGVKEDDK